MVVPPAVTTTTTTTITHLDIESILVRPVFIPITHGSNRLQVVLYLLHKLLCHKVARCGHMKHLVVVVVVVVERRRRRRRRGKWTMLG